MPDTISNYRLVRLTLHVPPVRPGLAHWSLTAIGVRRGIPDARPLQGGMVPLVGPLPTEEEIWEALDRVVGQYLLT